MEPNEFNDRSGRRREQATASASPPLRTIVLSAIAASVTATGLWAVGVVRARNLEDSRVTLLFAGIGTMLGLIGVGGIAAAAGQGMRSRRGRR
ncbi:hypothetical protein FOB82_10095 [Corynebacterium xerosis]|uniref:Uncharacterized protein n=1 Tax=Corynebacterium xerosis TaxID=1725 RepID=A0A6B8THS7_9CORY|nr:hypothetical protein [Corynebacterium xerosis]QGS35234.1 hypothetical protein FOB82_10095 [Corynebacterium xerosis]